MSLVEDIKTGKIKPTYHATSRMIKDLAETTAWQDMMMTLAEWIVTRHGQWETMGKGFHEDGSSATMKDFAFTQGEVSMARELMNLPEILITDLQIQEEHHERREED